MNYVVMFMIESNPKDYYFLTSGIILYYFSCFMKVICEEHLYEFFIIVEKVD